MTLTRMFTCSLDTKLLGLALLCILRYYAMGEGGRWELAGVQPHGVLMADGSPELVLGIF
jgi:hypothetical protein